jgi:hypothetical protein
MASSFKGWVVAYSEEEALAGGVDIHADQSYAMDCMWDNGGEYGVYEIEFQPVTIAPVVLSIEEFKAKIKNVDEPQEAWQDYAAQHRPFDEWWKDGGKATWSLETDDAVAALKELMGES